MTRSDLSLINRYFAGELSAADAMRVEYRLESDIQFRALAMPIQLIWELPQRMDSGRSLVDDVVARGTWKILEKRIELEQRGIHTSTLAEKHANLRRRRATRFTIIAGLITGWVIAWMRPQWFPVPTFYTHADAPLYEQLSERLPEETLVALAPGSHIAYARWLSGMREHALYLDGEATFLIAANSRHSVVVAGPGVEVRANGGRFTIQAYESVSHAHVSVQEGHVQVRARTLYGYGELLTLRAGNAVLVGPGLQIMPDEFSIPPWRFGVKWP